MLIVKVIAALALLVTAIAAWDVYAGKRRSRDRFEQRHRNLAHQLEWKDRDQER